MGRSWTLTGAGALLLMLAHRLYVKMSKTRQATPTSKVTIHDDRGARKPYRFQSLYLGKMPPPLMPDPLDAFAQGLGVRPKNRLASNQYRGDYEFYAAQESALRYVPVDGAFQYAIDVDLFGMDWHELEARLGALSAAGLIIALPDESSDDPFHFVLYEQGQKREIEVVDDKEDEEMGQLRILERRD